MFKPRPNVSEYGLILFQDLGEARSLQVTATSRCCGLNGPPDPEASFQRLTGHQPPPENCLTRSALPSITASSDAWQGGPGLS